VRACDRYENSIASAGYATMLTGRTFGEQSGRSKNVTQINIQFIFE
jgi:hypothetical protein